MNLISQENSSLKLEIKKLQLSVNSPGKIVASLGSINKSNLSMDNLIKEKSELKEENEKLVLILSKEEPKAEPAKEEPKTPGDIMPEPVIVADQSEDGEVKPVATSQQEQWESQARQSLSNLNITVENKAWKAALADAENVVHYIKLVVQEEDK